MQIPVHPRRDALLPDALPLLFALVDLALVSCASILVLLLASGGATPIPAAIEFGAVAAGLCVALLATSGAYRINPRYVGLHGVARLGAAVGGAMVALALLLALATGGAPAPAGGPATALLAAPPACLAVAGARLAVRVRVSRREGRSTPRAVPTLLVGAGDAGAQVLRSLNGASSRHRVVGLLDDDARAWGTDLDGAAVLGPIKDLERHVRENDVKTVVICIAGAGSALVRAIVQRCGDVGVGDVRILPPLHEIMDGRVTIESTRRIRLEDLLQREKVHIDHESLRAQVGGRRVVVTGGAGTIGSELCRQLARLGPERLVVLDVDETRLHETGLALRALAPGLPLEEALVDVRDATGLGRLFARVRPHVVFHAAAFKHVPMMERWPASALDVNVLGTAMVAEAAERHDCERFVLISTDKAVEPSSVMGASKRLAELVLFAATPPGEPEAPRMLRSAVRFGNVIGSRGSVIPTFERQLQDGRPLTVTHPDMERYFMMTSEAVSLVLETLAHGRGRDLFVLDMGKPVNILHVAREFVRLHGLRPEVDVPIVITGLRPGEKLSEILVYPDEVLESSGHPRIMRVQAHGALDAGDILERVREIVAARDDAAALAYLETRFPSLSAATHAVEVVAAPGAPRPARVSVGPARAEGSR